MDCLSLKEYLTDFSKPKDIRRGPICFAYEIFDGTWIDAIVVCHNKLIILELKSGCDMRPDTLIGHRSQVLGYFNKITRCNRVIWEETISNRMLPLSCDWAAYRSK